MGKTRRIIRDHKEEIESRRMWNAIMIRSLPKEVFNEEVIIQNDIDKDCNTINCQYFNHNHSVFQRCSIGDWNCPYALELLVMRQHNSTTSS